jgi:hypothetical protein
MTALHTRLRALLDLGHTVRSEAHGRRGEVVEVDLVAGIAVVRTQRGRGATSFEVGDEVVLQRRGKRLWVLVDCPILPAVRRRRSVAPCPPTST